MNRYNRGHMAGGPSKASASTTCQKCLKKDNYECKGEVQARPYVSRPSRTQQLLDPKLVPKLTSDIPQDLMRKKGIADEQLLKLEQERGRTQEKNNSHLDETGKRRSPSSASSVSVSTISTRASQSPPSKETPQYTNSGRARVSKSRSPPPQKTNEFERKRRRRAPSSSSASYRSEPRSSGRERYKGHDNDEGTGTNYKRTSPSMKSKRTRSKSPYGRVRSPSEKHGHGEEERNQRGGNDQTRQNQSLRERSLSPFSKRLALTKAMNMVGN